MNEILQGSVFDRIGDVPDGWADVILTDPPYNSGGTARDKKAATGRKYCDNDYNGAHRFPDFENDGMDQRSATEFWRSTFEKARKKTKKGGLLLTFIDWRNLPAMTDAVQMAGYTWLGVAIWDKKNSRPNPDRFRNDCEYIVWGSNGDRPAITRKGCKVLPGCFRCTSVHTKEKHHQTEKPVELLEQLLQIVPDGGRVLDIFAGSGSTNVAAAHLGLECIGIELSEEYAETAKARIREALEGQQTFKF